MHWRDQDWPQYVPVAERRERARRAMARLRKKGMTIEPVVIEGRAITRTFWGNAWCEHLMRFASLANRLERGRTYVRNGSVCHLEIDAGEVRALVMGNELYEVKLGVKPLAAARWSAIRRRCAGSVGSIMDLLQGRLSAGVMGVVTDRDEGLFPQPREFRPSCSCPDQADVCKHVAAVFYGVGARLDERPQMLFELRGVDHRELVGDDADALSALTSRGGGPRLAESELADVFGIEFEEDLPAGGVEGGATEGRENASAARGRRRRSRRDGDGDGDGNSRGETPRRKVRARAPKPATRVPPPGGGRGAALPDPLLPEHVHALRERLGVSRAQLGRLLGMSGAGVGVWERRDGPLSVHASSREALARVWRMSRAAALRELEGRPGASAPSRGSGKRSKHRR